MVPVIISRRVVCNCGHHLVVWARLWPYATPPHGGNAIRAHARVAGAALEHYKTYTWQMFLDPRKPRDAYRLTVLRKCFNSRLEVCGRVRHLESGCCRSSTHALTLLLTSGVNALFPAGNQHAPLTPMPQSRAERPTCMHATAECALGVACSLFPVLRCAT